jgi:hypothetical protein
MFVVELASAKTANGLCTSPGSGRVVNLSTLILGDEAASGLGGRRLSAHNVEFRATVVASAFSFCHISKFSPRFRFPLRISFSACSLSRSAFRFLVFPLKDGRYSQLVWIPRPEHREHGRPPSQRSFCLLHDEHARAVRGFSLSALSAERPVWCGEAIASRVEAKLLDLGDREGPASCEGDTRCMGSMEAAIAVDAAWLEKGVPWTRRSCY